VPQLPLRHQQPVAEQPVEGGVLEVGLAVAGVIADEHPLDVAGVGDHVRLDGPQVEADHIAVCGRGRLEEAEGVAGVLGAVAHHGQPARSRWVGAHADASPTEV
jgi:hypothetical protein